MGCSPRPWCVLHSVGRVACGAWGRAVIGGRPLLIHGHPGHELRLFRWMEEHKPILFLMTDGSGRCGARTDYSRACAQRAGATASGIFGLASDRCWYDAILSGDLSLFRTVVDAVVEIGAAQTSPLLVSDAVDGYNPMHDLCEATVAAAVAKLRLMGLPATHLVARAVPGSGGRCVVDAPVEGGHLRRKLAAIAAYAPLAEEVARVLGEEPEALHRERLFQPSFEWPDVWTPEWERIGAERVAASKYARPIEYVRHVRPIARALLCSPARAATQAEHATCES